MGLGLGLGLGLGTGMRTRTGLGTGAEAGSGLSSDMDTGSGLGTGAGTKRGLDTDNKKQEDGFFNLIGEKMTSKTIAIDGVNYVREDASELAKNTEGLEYVIIRTYSAGVHAGYLKKREGDYVELSNARRLWYWDGAASLSQLAMEGVSKPENCKFPCEVTTIHLKWEEIIPTTEKARQSIAAVKIWKA